MNICAIVGCYVQTPHVHTTGGKMSKHDPTKMAHTYSHCVECCSAQTNDLKQRLAASEKEVERLTGLLGLARVDMSILEQRLAASEPEKAKLHAELKSWETDSSTWEAENVALKQQLATFLSIADLQKLTGESQSAWRKRLGRREIPFVRLGANVRVRREDLDQWLAERTIPRRERE